MLQTSHNNDIADGDLPPLTLPQRHFWRMADCGFKYFAMVFMYCTTYRRHSTPTYRDFKTFAMATMRYDEVEPMTLAANAIAHRHRARHELMTIVSASGLFWSNIAIVAD